MTELPRTVDVRVGSSTDALTPLSSAERAIEIAFSASDRRPERNPWLFEAAVHEKTSSDSPCLKSDAMYRSASTVPLLLMATWLSGVCNAPPKQ